MSMNNFVVLLADDDTDDCIFFQEAIEEVILADHFTVVHNGEQLMKFLLNETKQLPDVLFLDLNMPRKNGFECLSEIKLSNTLKGLAVVIFSTSFEQTVVNKLYENGAHYFIRKPPEFSKFKKVILQTITLILEGDDSQPARENFVITRQLV